jgi:hypothetical protein
MKIDRRCFIAWLGSFIAAPFIIKNSGLIMPIHDRGIIDPFYVGLYITKDYGTMLNYKKNIIVQRNEFKKFDICEPGNSFNSTHKYSYWLLKGAEAQRLLTI